MVVVCYRGRRPPLTAASSQYTVNAMKLADTYLQQLRALHNQAHAAKTKLQAAIASYDAAHINAVSDHGVVAEDVVCCLTCGEIFVKPQDGAQPVCPGCHPAAADE
jgi:formylmethanofuran dehydrogenase subunit E